MPSRGGLYQISAWFIFFLFLSLFRFQIIQSFWGVGGRKLEWYPQNDPKFSRTTLKQEWKYSFNRTNNIINFPWLRIAFLRGAIKIKNADGRIGIKYSELFLPLACLTSCFPVWACISLCNSSSSHAFGFRVRSASCSASRRLLSARSLGSPCLLRGIIRPWNGHCNNEKKKRFDTKLQ